MENKFCVEKKRTKVNELVEDVNPYLRTFYGPFVVAKEEEIVAIKCEQSKSQNKCDPDKGICSL